MFRFCLFLITFSTFLQFGFIPIIRITSFVQAIHPHTEMGDKKQALYKLFAAYIHTVPLEQLLESIERARLDAKLRYVVIYGRPAAIAWAGPNVLTDRICERLRSN